MAFLTATEGPLEGQSFKIPDSDRVIVGRYEIYDLIVPDPSISRKHFAVERRADGYYIVDLGSLNGTQLNGHRVSTAKLEEDDLIAAGQTVLAFHEGEIGAAAPAAASADEDVEVIGDDDIIMEPSEPRSTPPPSSPATIPMPAASPPGGGKGAREPAKTRRTYKSDSDKVKASPSAKGAHKSAGRCAACGKKVTQEDVDTGNCAKTRLGFVCSACIEKRQKSGEKGSLEKFITERQKRRR